MRRTLIGSTVLLAAALALTGCSAPSGAGGADSGNYSQPDAPMPDQGVSGGVAGGDGGLATDEGTGTPTTDRQVIMTGNVTITTDDPIAASREAVRIVEAAGGRVDGRTEYAPTGGDKGSASLELRIPADKLTATLDKIEKLGRADEVTLSTSDVTVESQDLDARISALRASIERLDALIAKAKNIDDLITLEGAISDRQAQLESLEAQQRYLADQVSMSSVSLYLRSDAEAPKVVPGDFWSGLATGWDAFVAFWAGLLVVLGVLLPWLISLALIAAIIILIVRRRRRPAAASAAPAQASERSSASKAKP
ncbi:MAG TPA: DUF4349 domain-containing protein [Pseudolysinimonas sp.]